MNPGRQVSVAHNSVYLLTSGYRTHLGKGCGSCTVNMHILLVMLGETQYLLHSQTPWHSVFPNDHVTLSLGCLYQCRIWSSNNSACVSVPEAHFGHMRRKCPFRVAEVGLHRLCINDKLDCSYTAEILLLDSWPRFMVDVWSLDGEMTALCNNLSLLSTTYYAGCYSFRFAPCMMMKHLPSHWDGTFFIITMWEVPGSRFIQAMQNN